MTQPPQPYHRWPSNENVDKHPISDRCLACGVWRYPQTWARPEKVEEQEAIAAGPCPGKETATCSATPPGYPTWTCRLPKGHNGKHQRGPLSWEGQVQ